MCPNACNLSPRSKQYPKDWAPGTKALFVPVIGVLSYALTMDITTTKRPSRPTAARDILKQDEHGRTSGAPMNRRMRPIDPA